MIRIVKKCVWLIFLSAWILAVLETTFDIIDGESDIANELIFLFVISPIFIVTLAIARNKINPY